MIGDFLRELDRHLHVSRRSRARILEEVRDHLDDAVARLQSRGIQPSAAQEQAVRAFGPAGELARQFNVQAATATMRRTPVVLAASAVTLVGGFLLAAITQPQPRVPVPAGVAVQVSFFGALLGLQVAAVAGVRVAARVAARWRSASVSTADRELVRRAGVICAIGLGVAAVGWTVAIGQRLHGRPVTAITGCVLMIAAAIAPAGLRGGPAAADDNAPDRSGLLLGLGERVIQMIQRWPVTSCSCAALVAALAAMARAETTFAAALVLGGIEAAAVVAGFVFLGPRLELR